MLDCDVSFDEGVACALMEDELCSVCDFVLEEEGVARPCMLSLSIVDDEHMRKVNAKWRDVDAATDVVSLELERPDDPDLAPGEPCELGDIVLAPAFIAEQAARYQVSAATETRLMLIHGMLHLLGYDHVLEDEAQKMEQREDELLAMLDSEAPEHNELVRHRHGE